MASSCVATIFTPFERGHCRRADFLRGFESAFQVIDDGEQVFGEGNDGVAALFDELALGALAKIFQLGVRAECAVVGLADLLFEVGTFSVSAGSVNLGLGLHFGRDAFEGGVEDFVTGVVESLVGHVLLLRSTCVCGCGLVRRESAGRGSYWVSDVSGLKYSLMRSRNDLRWGETSVFSTSASSRRSFSCLAVIFFGTSM